MYDEVVKILMEFLIKAEQIPEEDLPEFVEIYAQKLVDRIEDYQALLKLD